MKEIETNDNKNKSENLFSYENKKFSTKDDIEYMEKKLKPFLWENIPLIGCYIYLWRFAFKYWEIESELLKKEMYKSYKKFFIWSLFIFMLLFALITPWWLYWIISTGIRNTKSKLE